MDSRLSLHEELCILLDSRNAYFQPPENIKMEYPCVRYKLSNPDVKFANNKPYSLVNGYEITFIDKDPDADYIAKMYSMFSNVRFDRCYTADNLNHWVFTLFY